MYDLFLKYLSQWSGNHCIQNSVKINTGSLFQFHVLSTVDTLTTCMREICRNIHFPLKFQSHLCTFWGKSVLENVNKEVK